MKTLMPQRMESMLITMHSLQMRNQPIKLETIADLMNLHYKAAYNVIRELQVRELIVKLGKTQKAIYHLTKKAEEAIEQNALAKLVNIKSVNQVKAPNQQNTITPTHVNFMKQMNQFLKDHEILLQENKSLREENVKLKNIINVIKQNIN